MGFILSFFCGSETGVFSLFVHPKFLKNCVFVLGHRVKWVHSSAFAALLFACGTFLSVFALFKENTAKQAVFEGGGVRWALRLKCL